MEKRKAVGEKIYIKDLSTEGTVLEVRENGFYLVNVGNNKQVVNEQGQIQRQ